MNPDPEKPTVSEEPQSIKSMQYAAFKTFMVRAGMIMGIGGIAMFFITASLVENPTIHYYIALAFAIFFTGLITLVLMGLIFYSSRLGYSGEFDGQ